MKEAKPLILLCALPALFVLAAFAPVQQWLAPATGWIHAHDRIAGVAFVGGYALSAVLVVPSAILTLAAGFVFGVREGVVLVSIGSVFGSAAAFLVARFCAREWLNRRIGHLPRFRALDTATRQDGFFIVFLTRLSPLLPFNLLNYCLGLTGVRFRDFVLGTWVGMLPVIAFYVYLGSLAKDTVALSGRLDQGLTGPALLASGFVATAALTVFVARRANRVLAEHLAAEVAEAPGPETLSA